MLDQNLTAFGNTLLAAAVAGVGSPAILYWAAKGRVDEWIQRSIEALRKQLTEERKEKMEDLRKEITGDVNGLGDKYTALLSLYNQTRSDVDTVRDRCTKMESRQDPVTQGVERIERKLDASLERMEDLARNQAVQAEQIKTLFNRGAA